MIKRGQLGGHEESISGFAIGIVLVIIIAMVAANFWELLPSKNKIDHDSAEKFKLIYAESLKVNAKKQSGSSLIPAQFREDLALVAFGKDEEVNCVGVNKPTNDACALSACLCLCDVSAESEMCKAKKAICQSYSGLDLDFDSSVCNFVQGKSEPVFVVIKYHKEGLSFTVQESTA